jgi:hypothetical protein
MLAKRLIGRHLFCRQLLVARGHVDYFSAMTRRCGKSGMV